VFLALVYLLLRRVVPLIIGSSNVRMNSEVEVVVLRHQLKVLKRRMGRPHLRRRDRLFMAAISWASCEHDGRRSWSAPRRCFAGTGSWCEGSGLTPGGRLAADLPSARRFETSS